MARFLNGLLSRHFPRDPHDSTSVIHVAPLLLNAAASAPEEIYRQFQTAPGGLTEMEVLRRRQEHGPNVVVAEARYHRLVLLGKAILNPLMVLLLLLAVVSCLIGDERAGAVMLAMVLLGVFLSLVQEDRADAAAAKFQSMIRVTSMVMRDGQAREVPLADLVPGDVVRLSAGDMIPADLRLVSCEDLHILQAGLTDQSSLVEKAAGAEEIAGRSPLELRNLCFLGTSVANGTALGVVVCTGRQTYLGNLVSTVV